MMLTRMDATIETRDFSFAYEDYFGFAEKPFSLTPDPKFLYRSESHANAFDLLQCAGKRREGFVVITGDIGTGKTTLCRAFLEQTDRKTFTALVLNPFISEEDLLYLILQDFGVVSREEVKRGRLAGLSKQALIDTLNDFLLSLQPLRASAVIVIDEAQNLPLQTLEQIRILSNLETDKEKLLQIVLLGQLNLRPLLKSPELRQLDQRISLRCELQPLTREEVGAYVAHRLSVAGGGAAVSLTPRALDRIHRISTGIPRLINLLCDRALLCAYADRTNRIVPATIMKSAESLELVPPSSGLVGWMKRRGTRAVAALGMAAMLALATAGVIAHVNDVSTAPPVALPAAPPLAVARLLEPPRAPAEGLEAGRLTDTGPQSAAPPE